MTSQNFKAKNHVKHYDCIIIGAGAAGMMAAAQAASTGKTVLVIDHAKAPGEKIRISGGGRCNFTNIHAGPKNFISQNPHFMKSALKRYDQHDFIALVDKHNIAYHEKTLGQLFCDESSKQIIQMLLDEMDEAGVELLLQASLIAIEKRESGFQLEIETQGTRQHLTCQSVVVACGGKSIPKMGASGFGYELAGRFGHSLTDIRPALVPLTFGDDVLPRLKSLAGLSKEGAEVSCGKTSFDEAVLFTHRGLSGPAILQISSYWRETQPIYLSLLPDMDLHSEMKAQRQANGKQTVLAYLSALLPKRLAHDILNYEKLTGNLADLSDKKLMKLAEAINRWELYPIGSEGYRTAEVTLGGVDTKDLNSKTMESKLVPGLYFIGEVVDVTGWLGGYNFQWAWSSGWVAGIAISEK